MRYLLAAGLCAVLAAPQPTFRSSTSLVEVDIIARDRDGRFVSGLTSDDFEVLEEGKPQSIQHFYLVTEKANITVEPLSTVVLPRSPDRTDRRILVFFFDNEHLSASALLKLKQGAMDFVNDQLLRPTSPASSSTARWSTGISPTRSRNSWTRSAARSPPSNRPRRACARCSSSRGIESLQEAAQIESGDRAVLADVGARVCGGDEARLCAADGGREFVEDKLQRKARLFIDQSRRAASATIRSIGYIVRNLSGLEGRKTLVVLSEGFHVEDARSSLPLVAGQASRAGVTIYCIDARGTSAQSGIAPASDVSVKGAGLSGFGDTSDEGLDILAAETGGMTLRHRDDLRRALADVASDTSTYYVLAYAPEILVLDGKYPPDHAEDEVGGPRRPRPPRLRGDAAGPRWRQLPHEVAPSGGLAGSEKSEVRNGLNSMDLLLIAALWLQASQQQAPRRRYRFRGAGRSKWTWRVTKDGRFVGRPSGRLTSEILEDGVPQKIQSGPADTALQLRLPNCERHCRTCPTRCVDGTSPGLDLHLRHAPPHGRRRPPDARGRGEVHRGAFSPGDLGGVVVDGRMANNRLTSDREELRRAAAEVKLPGDLRSRQLDLREWPRLQDEFEAYENRAQRSRHDRARRRARVQRRSRPVPDGVARAAGAIEGAAAGGGVPQGHAADADRWSTRCRRGSREFPGRKTVSSSRRVRPAGPGDTAPAGCRTGGARRRAFLCDRRARPEPRVERRPHRPAARRQSDERARVVRQPGRRSEQPRRDTGGFAIRNENNIGRALDAIQKDAGTYYVIAYSPANNEFDGKYRAIDVKVSRPGVSVRARRGYLALDPARLVTPKPPADVGGAGNEVREPPKPAETKPVR
jgi:VWFA-related protein